MIGRFFLSLYVGRMTEYLFEPAISAQYARAADERTRYRC